MPSTRTAADIPIVGSGAAGALAAIDDSSAGADVLVLEALNDFGGAAASSGGGICIPAGSALQEQRGISGGRVAARTMLAAARMPSPV